MSVNFQFNLGANKLKILTALAFVGGEVKTYWHHHYPTEKKPDDWEDIYSCYSYGASDGHSNAVITNGYSSEDFINLVTKDDFFEGTKFIDKFLKLGYEGERLERLKQATVDGLKHAVYYKLADNMQYIRNHERLIHDGLILEQTGYWLRTNKISSSGIASLQLLRAEVNKLHSIVSGIKFDDLLKIQFEDKSLQEKILKELG